MFYKCKDWDWEFNFWNNDHNFKQPRGQKNQPSVLGICYHLKEEITAMVE